MDPNETLRILREYVAAGLDFAERCQRDPDGMTEEEEALAGTVVEIATTLQALDEWLSKGGFLPRPWQAKTDPPRTLAKIGELSHRFTGAIGRSESDQIRHLTEAEPLGGPVPGVDDSHLPDVEDVWTDPVAALVERDNHE